MKPSGESTEEQIEKLPGHARILIQRLRRELEDRDRTISELLTELTSGADPSRVSYTKSGDFHARPLPDGAQLNFRVGYGWIRVMIQGDALDINADSTILVGPQASNSIKLKHVSRFE